MNPSWTDVGVFWITIFVGLVTAAATAINYFLYRSQVAPEVIVYVTADQRRPSIINLIIENIGKGVAKNIRFELSHPIPQKAFGFENPPLASTMTAGPLISGIPALGPGARRVITWGQYGGLHAALGDRVVLVTARYKADVKTPWDREDIVTESFLEVKSLELTDASDHNYDKVAAEQLKTIARALEQVSYGRSTLRIEVHRSPDAAAVQEADPDEGL